MRLNTKARYALRAMVEVHRATCGGKPVSLEQVARHTRISHRYLEQLARALRDAGMLRGVRGRRGGYLLARQPEEISVGDVVQAVIGAINIVDCVREPDRCLIAGICECRRVYGAINQGLIDAMNAFSLADLTDGSYSGSPPDRTANHHNAGAPSPGQTAALGRAPRALPCRSS